MPASNHRSPTAPAVRYGTAALADVFPSALAALGVPGHPNALALADTARVVVLLVDGLGATLLRRYAECAPFLATLGDRQLTAGFPSTTVASLASLTTGTPPGEHGLTGYSSYVEEVGGPVNWLAWRPVGKGSDLRDRLVPEEVQPRPTMFEQAADAGVAVTVAAPAQFEGSGLTRALFRGGRYAGTVAPGDVVARAAEGALWGNRSLVYCYISELDLVGHVRGPDSAAWREQLRVVDTFAAQLASRLPPAATLLVTGDHGMVAVDPEETVDFDATAALREGVRGLAGEPRARSVHAQPGAAEDVLGRWREALGAGWHVVSRDEAITAGWYGPDVGEVARRRIGDVVAIAAGRGAVVRRRVESRLSGLPGQHGALTDDDLLVPLLIPAGGREGD